MRLLALALLALAGTAQAATTATVTPGDWPLYRGSTIVSRHATLDACVEAAKALAVTRSYTCRTSAGVAITITPDVCTAPQPAAETQTVQCPTGTTGSWQQSRSYVAAPFPTCWTAGAWTPASAPSGACVATPPVADCTVLFTDFASAPASGFATVIGEGFPASAGVKVAGSPVSIRARGPAANSALSAITFDTGGRAGAVTVDGCAGSVPLASHAGRLLYVSLSGNDATAVPNDPSKPYRYAQTANRGGAYGALQPGDVIVLRAGEYHDVGFEGRFLRSRDKDGTSAKPIGITAYPGERVVVYSGPSGGIHGRAGGYASGGDYFTVSNLVLNGGDASVADGPLNLQTDSDGWRVVNNDIGPWAAGSNARAGGIAGNGAGLFIAGNAVHDIGGGTLNHGMYFDTGATGEIAWNTVRNVAGGNLVQFFDNLGMADLSVSFHDNVLENGGRYGINIADGTSIADVYRNKVRGTAFSGVRFNVYGSPGVDVWVHDNDISETNRTRYAGIGAVNCDWQLTSAQRARFERNKVAAGPLADGYYAQGGNCPALSFGENAWSGLPGPSPQ